MKLRHFIFVLLLIVIANCSKHQGHRKSKTSKSKQNPTHKTKLPLSQVEVQTEDEGSKAPTNSSHLRSALNVLAPENDVKANSEYESPLLMKTVTEKFHSEMPRSSSRPDGLNSSRSDVVFEVINMEPYSSWKSRLNKRFFILAALYVVSGLVGIIATYCIARLIVSRRKRHRQYMLLTKSDMGYHKGGGGI